MSSSNDLNNFWRKNIAQASKTTATQTATEFELQAEVDRLRDALERIYQTGRGIHVEIARDALNG